MSIIELGALGEFLGSIGVIATLIYLAVQVRSGARNSAIDARQRVLDRFSDAKANMIHSDFGASIRKVVNMEDNPSEAETTKFFHIMAVFADNMYNAIRLHDEGVLDDEAFDYIAGQFVSVCATPGGNRWWHDFLSFAPPSLAKFVNQRLEGVSIVKPEGISSRSESERAASSVDW